MKSILFCLILFQFLLKAKPHGRLMEPESRATRWRYNQSAPIDYNDNQGYCGGFFIQWNRNNGLCGLCGDDYSSPIPRDHELGGKYGEGVIVRSYSKGEEINVSVFITANHRGYFLFFLCNLDFHGFEEEECFKLLKVKSGDKKNFITPSVYGWFNSTVLLPFESCDHCVFRWVYVAGNNWGVCENGKGSLGCGHQEEFRACADIKIN